MPTDRTKNPAAEEALRRIRDQFYIPRETYRFKATPDRDTPSWTHPHEARVAGDTLGTLLVCSVRYAIGRRTYMPSLIADIVRRHWQDIDAAARQALRRDVGEAIDGPGSLGDACDAQTWRDLHAWMEAHHAD